MATEYDNMSRDDISKFCQESSTKTPLELISFLQHFELLHRFRVCICRTQMVLVQRPDVPDRWRWRCPKSGCRKTLTIRKNTMFETFDKSFSFCLLCIFHWCIETRQNDQAEIIDASRNTIIKFHKFLR